MLFILSLLGRLMWLYMMLIFFRVILSWFSGAYLGRPAQLLARITDPYLNWWRRFPIFRTRYIDLSPVAALTALSLAQTICATVANYGSLSLGFLLVIVLRAAWSVISFALGFFIIVLLLRLFAYLTNRNIYSAFWRIIDTIAQPVLYRITRIFFRHRLINYLAGIFLSTGVLAALAVVGSFLVRTLSVVLLRLPV